MDELWQPEPNPEEPLPPSPRWRRFKAVAGWLVQGLAAAALLVIVLIFFLTRTDRGVTMVVGHVLQRLPIQGEITATGARSDRLLEGVRLIGLSIQGDDGRAFMLADSVGLRYNWRALISADVLLDSLAIWNPRVTLTRYPGEREFNVKRIFSFEGEVRDTVKAPSNDLMFNGVSIHGGEVRVLHPAGKRSGARWVTEPAPLGDSLLLRHVFTDIDARLPRVVLRARDASEQRVTIDSLSFLGEVLADPVRVRGVKGQLRFVGARLDLDLDRLALDHSEAQGTAFLDAPPGDDPLHFGFDIRTPGFDLNDLAWVDARVGSGLAVGGVAMDASGELRRVSFHALQITSPESSLRLDGTVTMSAEEVGFEDLDMRAAPLALTRVDPWLAAQLPVGGSVAGTAVLDGTLAELTTRGQVTLQRAGPGEEPITADFSGRLHMADGLGFTDLRATLDPFDFGVLGAFTDGARIQGGGRVTLEATGRASDSISFTAGIHHRPRDLPASDVIAVGTVQRREGSWAVNIRADAQSLSLTALAHDYPSLPLTGEVSGSWGVRGPLADLTLDTDLATDGGPLALTARFNATDPGAHYAVEGQVSDFVLSRVVTNVPDPTVITGYVNVEGRGTDFGTLTMDARARLRPSRLGGLRVDTAGVALRVGMGLLHVDTLDGVVGGIAVQGRGTLGMERGGPEGAMTIAFQSDSLGRLRPLVLGDVVIVRDTLSELDRELLRAEGVNLDTLPTRADVAVAGAVRGQVALTGSIRDFAAEGNSSFARIRYGRNVVKAVDLAFEGAGLPGLGGSLSATIAADSLSLLGREFDGARLGFEYAQPQGRFDLALQRRQAEDYTSRGAFAVRGEEGSLQLDELAFRFDSITWSLDRPAVMAWNEQGLRIRDFVLSGPADSLHLEAEGLIPRRGPADLRVGVEGLRLERLARLLQREELGLTGGLALSARVTGTAEAPLIIGSFDAKDLALETFSLTRFAGSIDYAGQTLRLSVGAWQDSLRVLAASGLVPVDLAFQEVPQRVPTDRQIDLLVAADSLPAGFLLGPVNELSDVRGTIAGQFHIVGTVSDPSPAGIMALNDAGWTFDALGVRHQNIRGTLTLRPDGTVDVEMAGRAGGGGVTTTGTVTLLPLTDPTFDLEITAENFQAVARTDVEASLTGAVALTGTYSRPVVRSRDGQPVRGEEGVLYVEEFQRTVGIVDLADQAFFAVVDTAVVNPRPLLGAAANPFLRNLRVDVDLVAERNSWLRSEQINVEMGGEVQVVYDRQSSDLVMLGALQAIRGTYSILGRTFQVASGTVEFVGTPGINPTLNIVASTRVRQAGASGGGNDNISIQATVSSTLLDPRVSLSSEGGAIAESDLVSYLVFGVPSYQLASGQAAQVQTAAWSLLGNTVGAGLSILQGTLASRLSSLVAREWGLDYFAISQPKELGLGSLDVAGTLASTTFEVGWYLDQDVFVTLLLAPLAGRAGTGTNPFGGARVDWVLSPNWTLQSFYEERYLRQPTLGFDQQSLQSRKVGGLFLFRDWGYSGPASTSPGASPAP